MKKLLILSALLIFACSGDDNDDNEDGLNQRSFNPPTWIQGVWEIDNVAIDFREDDFCITQFGSASCLKTIIELNSDDPNFNINVYEEISATRYYFIFTHGPNEITTEFKKVSDISINCLQYPFNNPTILNKQ
tara:strand:- start:75 stop:473 length:399 start_codon:yes stop_codon:yes gene_type:complete